MLCSRSTSGSQSQITQVDKAPCPVEQAPLRLHSRGLRLIESQLGLVVSIAQKHLGAVVPMLDLIEEGNIGWMDAVRSFAEKPVGDFAAHAATCIEDAIVNSLCKSKSQTCVSHVQVVGATSPLNSSNTGQNVEMSDYNN